MGQVWINGFAFRRRGRFYVVRRQSGLSNQRGRGAVTTSKEKISFYRTVEVEVE